MRVKLPGQIRIDPSNGQDRDDVRQQPASTGRQDLPAAEGRAASSVGDAARVRDQVGHGGARVVVGRGRDPNQRPDDRLPGRRAAGPVVHRRRDANLAGRHSSFVLRAERPDGQQMIDGLALRMPPGLLAKLKGVPRCGMPRRTRGRVRSARASGPRPLAPGRADSVLPAGRGVSDRPVQGRPVRAGGRGAGRRPARSTSGWSWCASS